MRSSGTEHKTTLNQCKANSAHVLKLDARENKAVVYYRWRGQDVRPGIVMVTHRGLSSLHRVVLKNKTVGLLLPNGA